ncbi:AfsR/SARP family transcriptional regulator [Actinokineospora enzanensis]|uniref:AfsR/SARP family transcriptional regulator n=1 Tax=Actinokineospora enzanensis TaxID=155975 RepID=UPI0003AA4CBA|nr:BTAD domain-containing putative transcriptional regulator [Actinokineospora enzanensis]
MITGEARYGVLGPLEVRFADRSVPIGGLKQRKLLAALLLNAGRPVALSRLVAAIWDADPPKTAEKQVRNAVSDLRRVLAEDSSKLELVAGGYRLDVADHVDATLFRDRIARARALPPDRPVAAIAAFRAALELWRGDVLAGLESAALCPQVERLRELRLAAFEDCVDLRLAHGEHRELLGELVESTREYPLRERLTAQLMVALHRSGAAGEATLAYHAFHRRLNEELGIDPGVELRDLHRRLLADNDNASTPAMPRSDLPRDTTSFTGRDAELDRVTESATLAGSTMVVSAIDGMAGVGKTALAVHVAHRLAPRFPDAQLFLDLHAHTPGQTPLTPTAALEGLLRALGVEQDRIPHDLDARASLWRATLSRRRVLVVLDNAAGTRQITPLLPSAPGCMTIVTSRHRLIDLDAVVLVLDVMPFDDAHALFVKVVGDERPLAEPAATREVLELCGYLPLAIRIAGSRLRHRRAWTVEYLATRLRDQRRRMDELNTDDHSVATAFNLSYEQLPEETKALFRMLGHIPGVDVDTHTAAALVRGSPFDTERALEELVDAHLLQQHQPGRYQFHDLLRSYAASLSLDIDSASERDEAVSRLLDHYLFTSAAAMDLVSPTEPVHRPNVTAGSTTHTLSNYAEALNWLNTERRNLLAAATRATEDGRFSHACELSGTLWRYYHISGYHHDAFDLHSNAADAADAAGDIRSRADALACRGYTNWWLSRYPQAIQDCEEAIDIARRIGDRSLAGRALHALGLVHVRIGADRDAHTALEETRVIGVETGDRVLEGYALRGLGDVHLRLGREDVAVASYEQAVAIALEVGNVTIEGYASRALGEIHARRGESEKGLAYCMRALELARRSRNRNVQTRVLRTVGDLHRDNGRLDLALENYAEGRRLAEETGHRYEIAYAHDGVARTLILRDDPTAAADHWHQALRLFDELDVPEADQVRQALTAL